MECHPSADHGIISRMEKSPFGSAPIQENAEKSIRLRVTDVCPWRCSFYHSEGGRDTADLSWGPELKEVIESLKRALPHIREVHFTGGEPTMNPELAAIAAGLSALGLEVKTTTNGQFDESVLRKLMEAGLRHFNFSIHSFDPERFREQQTGRGASRLVQTGDMVRKKAPSATWATSQIEREKSMILAARDLGATVKINTVVSSAADQRNAKEVLDWAREHRIPLRLLNDLGNGQTSLDAIREFIRRVEAQDVLRKVTIGRSSCSTVYRLPDGYEFVFKQIRDQRIASMCRECPRNANGTCEEQFYGIRLQKNIRGEFRVRLCLQETNRQTDMTWQEFLRSPQLKEIQSFLA